MRRLGQPPDAIVTLARAAVGRERRGVLALVRGEILADAPRSRGTLPVAEVMPYGLGEALGRPEAVVTRVDLEEEYRSFTRSELERFERGRDFYIADEGGRALVRIVEPIVDPIVDGAGRLHDRVELRVDGAFRTHEIAPTDSRPLRHAYLRALRVGDPAWVLGRAALERDASGLGAGGYREAPELLAFSGGLGPLHLFDEAAFRQLAAWHALPWYRKLSVLVRT